MENYNKIPIWENLNRITYLKKFRQLINDYFLGAQYDYTGVRLDSKAEKARPEINKMSLRVSKYILKAGISTEITHFPAPAIGGYVTRIDLIFNLFNLPDYDVLPIEVIDLIDKAIGVYEEDKLSAFFRSINPLFWLKKLLAKIALAPFSLLSLAGFESEKIRKSLIGKLLSLLFQLVALIASIVTILQILGYNDAIKNLRSLIDSYISR